MGKSFLESVNGLNLHIKTVLEEVFIQDIPSITFGKKLWIMLMVILPSESCFCIAGLPRWGNEGAVYISFSAWFVKRHT